MKHVSSPDLRPLVLACAAGLTLIAPVHAQTRQGSSDRLNQLEQQVAEQSRLLEVLRESLVQQERNVEQLRRSLQAERLGELSGRGVQSTQPSSSSPQESASSIAGTDPAPMSAALDAQDPEQQPVGRASAESTRPPEIAQIFDQPGVLTPRGKFVLEPSFQLDYSSNNRVALVGYTIIPAILIGLIDVRQVKTSLGTLSLAGRYGVTHRFELEARVPYTYVSADTVSREIFTGSAQDSVFNANGHGIGDVEVTGRFQLNQGAPDRPFYVGWLRYKTRTGKDLFDVVTDCVTRCVSNATGTGLPLELPTGSGFASLQPGITWLYPSDPVVFFGSFSYLYNFQREDVSRTVLTGAPTGYQQTTTEFIGDMKVGDIIGLNLGLGLALNEKAAISMGFDTNVIAKTKQNGEYSPGAVRLVLGTLLFGGSYRFNDKVSLNVAVGVGVTEDTPDLSLTTRVPITF